LDASEDIEHAFLHPDQIKAQIRAGRFSQLHHIATFYMCMEHLAARGGGER
jgi:hypothetical protein